MTIILSFCRTRVYSNQMLPFWQRKCQETLWTNWRNKTSSSQSLGSQWREWEPFRSSRAQMARLGLSALLSTLNYDSSLFLICCSSFSIFVFFFFFLYEIIELNLLCEKPSKLRNKGCVKLILQTCLYWLHI